MVLEWKERGHEVKDHQPAQNLECINALRNCVLIKFFRTTGLRAQMELLPYLISLWDVDREIFIIKGQEIKLDETDIYFITRLSRWGEVIQLFGSLPGGEITRTLFQKHCPGAEMTNGGKVKIATIANNLILEQFCSLWHVYLARKPCMMLQNPSSSILLHVWLLPYLTGVEAFWQIWKDKYPRGSMDTWSNLGSDRY